MDFLLGFISGLIIGAIGIMIVIRNNKKHFTKVLEYVDSNKINALREYITKKK